MDVAQDRGFAELASYLGTRRRHVQAALPELGGLLVSP
jgi:hypothetical protein